MRALLIGALFVVPSSAALAASNGGYGPVCDTAGECISGSARPSVSVTALSNGWIGVKRGNVGVAFIDLSATTTDFGVSDSTLFTAYDADDNAVLTMAVADGYVFKQSDEPTIADAMGGVLTLTVGAEPIDYILPPAE